MSSLKTQLISSIAACFIGSFSLAANALVINPGETIGLPGTTVAAEPQLAGVVLEDEIIHFNFNANAPISGRVQQRVVRSSVDNTIDFYWRVMNDSTSQASIGSFRVGNFMSPEYDVNWRIDGLGDESPETAHRFDGAFESYVNFIFDSDGLAAGDSSHFFFFDTTATSYSKNAFFDLTNISTSDISMSFAAFAPEMRAVAEPSSIALMGLGIAGLLVSRRKRA